MKNKFILLFCILVITQISGILSKNLPEDSTKFCSSLDESYEICMDSAIPNIGHYFLDDGVDAPELDPLKIQSVSIYKKLNKNVEFRGLVEDIVIHGLQNTNLERIRLDPETLDGYIHLTIPSIYAKSKYSMALKYGNTNTTYTGVSNGNATDIDLQFYFKLENIVKSDVEYFTIKNMKGKILVKKAQIMSKTFDPELQSTADFFVDYFNKNYKRLLNDPNSMFQKHAIEMSRIIAEEFLSTVPAEKLMAE